VSARTARTARSRRPRRPPPRAAAPPAATLRGRVAALPRIGRAVAGAVGCVAATVGLVFAVAPSLKPDPPPVDKGATLRNAQVEPALRFGEYLDRIEQSRQPYGAAALGRRGAFVEFDFSIRGYKDKRLPLRWQLVDARTGAQLRHSRDLRIRPLVNTDAGSWSVWIPSVRHARRMYVQVQLYNDAGRVPIGRIRTREFDGARA